MDNPKRQHYIPRMLLKHFVNEEGRLFFYKKDLPEIGVKSATPRDLFVKKDLYTFTGSAGGKDYFVEKKVFSKLEGEADPVVHKIVDKARKGRTPGLTVAEREVFDWFFVTLHRRLPDVFAHLIPEILDSKDMQRQYRDCTGMAESDPIDCEAMEEFLWKEIWPRSFLETDELMEQVLLPTLSGMNLWVAVIPQGQAGFIVGSSPVIAPSELSDPDSERIVALAHDVAVCFIHDHRERKYEMSAKDVDDFNRDLFNRSTVVAGPSDQQLESLIALDKAMETD